jgi:hypothetical protein
VVKATPRQLHPRERPGTNYNGSWMCPRAGLDGCGISHTEIRSPDRPPRDEPLYHVSCPSSMYDPGKQMERCAYVSESVLPLNRVKQCFSTLVRPRPGKFLFIRRGTGPNKFTRKYLSIFLSSYIKLT